MNKGKVISNIIIFIFISGFSAVIIAEVNRYYEGKILLEKKETTFAVMDNWGFSTGSASSSPEYKFHVKGKVYKNYLKWLFFCDGPNPNATLIKELNSIKFTVIYNPDDPNINRILLRKRDFEKHGLSYPDSLEAVLTRYFECDRSWTTIAWDP